LLASLAGWRPFTVAVVGDFMLDQHIYGDAERLSADAPVPVLLVRKTESHAGGAANVCLDIRALKGDVLAFGVVGDDAAAEQLRSALEAQGVDTTGIVTDPSRPTTLKQNLIGLAQARHPQKMFRLDHESREPIGAEAADRLLEALGLALLRVDAVCIEDYAKGVCSEALCRAVIDMARAAGKPVFVDPARLSDYARYKGACAITPNRTEAEIATGIATCQAASTEHNAALAQKLMSVCELDAVVLTLDRHGALLLERGGEPSAVPTVARDVYDVTGAGDMFLAALTAARVNGLAWHEAVMFANAAAGLEVEVFGVQPIPFEQVQHALLAQAGALTGKVRSLELLCAEVMARRRAGEKIVFTNGCFDVLHSGHVTLLEKAAALGDFLVVAINDDASVQRLKGPSRPVNSQEDRARVLAALGCVGAVAVFAEDTPMRLIEAVRPDVLVKGGDYSKEQVVGGALVESYGGRVALVELVAGKSSTRTIEQIRGAG
jgi:D-beta-D-heptose 7-phosphate kinase/D-beta-D-heptose 1-phosphate adenosyltransferase